MAKARLMIVEDEGIVSLDLSERLAGLGYDVVCVVASAEEAIRRARETKPDLILVDIVLRGEMDGIEAVQRIRTEVDAAVVYLTAHVDDTTVQRAKITGPYGYIVKPYDGDELRVAVEVGLYKHEMERRLRQSEEMYRLVSELASDYYYSVLIGDPWTVEWIGGAFEQITGLAPDEIFSIDGWLPNLHPDDVPVIRQSMDRILSGRPSVCEYRIRTSTGEERWLRDHSRPVWSRDGSRIERLVGAVQNITAQRQAQEALWRSEERYALAMRAANIGTWDWDIASGTLHWSDRIEPMFGFGPGEFGATYEAFLECVHPDDRQPVIDAVDACIENGDDYYIEHRIIWPDGSVHWVLETGDVVRDASGTAVRMLGIVQDVTARRAAEEALQQQTAELEAQNKELDAFAHTVAHDLRNPLGLVTGFAEVLESEHAALSAQDLERHLQTIAHHGRRLAQIVDDLLMLSVVRKADLELEPLDMAGIVAEALARMRPTLDVCRAEVVLPDAWPAALGHATWVGQVWINYLSNACKYGGRPPRIELGADAQADGMVRFWVRDNGPGLSPEEQARLFIPFTQLAGAEARGHGLGLSIVRRIASKLGGQVGVSSEGLPGRGSTFSFTLPAVPAAGADGSEGTGR